MLEQKQTKNRSTVKGVDVTFSPEVFAALEEIAEKKCKSVTEVIEDAIGLERWYLRTREEGCKVVIEGKDGEIWELVRD